jgi:hypothetical protein
MCSIDVNHEKNRYLTIAALFRGNLSTSEIESNSYYFFKKNNLKFY